MMSKSRVESLAILGGAPAFTEPLHVGRPNVVNRERFLARVRDLLDRRWLTNAGPFVCEFEERVAELLGTAHCVAVCNGTLGLELVLRACGIEGEIIVPSFTFIATAHAVRMVGLTPVFADIDPVTHCLDPRAAERAITARTASILGVHLWGNPCAVAPLSEVADRHGLTLLFDAAHAFGCSLDGRRVGGFGRAEVFSFHATKYLNTFEGGAITTDDGELADRLRLMRNFGFAGYDRVVSLGTNAKMNEVSAAMGLAGLESIEETVAHNRANFERYREGLGGLSGLDVMPHDSVEQNNHQYVVVEVDERQAGLSRDLLMRVLQAENVLVRRYFYPGCHKMEPYHTLDPTVGRGLPATEQVARRVLQLPTGTGVGGREIDGVAALMRLALDNSSTLRRRLGESQGDGIVETAGGK